MVNVVVVCTGPEREEMMKTPWELITAVGINSLEQTQDNPDVHCQNVQFAGEGAPENGAANGSEAK